MRTRRTGALAGALAVLALVAAACGGTSSAGDSAQAGECQTPETPVITFAAYSAARGLRQDHLGLPGEVEGGAQRAAGHLPGVLRRLHDAVPER